MLSRKDTPLDYVDALSALKAALQATNLHNRIALVGEAIGHLHDLQMEAITERSRRDIIADKAIKAGISVTS